MLRNSLRFANRGKQNLVVVRNYSSSITTTTASNFRRRQSFADSAGAFVDSCLKMGLYGGGIGAFGGFAFGALCGAIETGKEYKHCSQTLGSKAATISLMTFGASMYGVIGGCCGAICGFIAGVTLPASLPLAIGCSIFMFRDPQ
jgi:hypothetical protein